MAGQRTGRSQFGFKMVLLAVLWCALHLKDLKAYQTLAVPGSGAPNKAELQKMTVPQLRAKLREKGKKVSGKKDELIERLLPKRNIPKAGDTAIDATDVFIPLGKRSTNGEPANKIRRLDTGGDWSGRVLASGPYAEVLPDCSVPFVNRHEEIYDLFEANADVILKLLRACAQSVEIDNWRPCNVAVAAQMFGSGKTTLGRNFIKQLNDPTFNKIFQAKRKADDWNHELERAKKAETRYYDLRGCKSLSEVGRRVDYESFRDRQATSDDIAQYILKQAVDLGVENPLFIHFDEIGGLGDNVRDLREAVRRTWDLMLKRQGEMPRIYFYLSGKSVPLAALGAASSPVGTKWIILDLLEEKHIKHIIESSTKATPSLLLPDLAKLAELPAALRQWTGGSPRLLVYSLRALHHLHCDEANHFGNAEEAMEAVYKILKQVSAVASEVFLAERDEAEWRQTWLYLILLAQLRVPCRREMTLPVGSDEHILDLLLGRLNVYISKPLTPIEDMKDVFYISHMKMVEKFVRERYSSDCRVQLFLGGEAVGVSAEDLLEQMVEQRIVVQACMCQEGQPKPWGDVMKPLLHGTKAERIEVFLDHGCPLNTFPKITNVVTPLEEVTLPLPKQLHSSNLAAAVNRLTSNRLYRPAPKSRSADLFIKQSKLTIEVQDKSGVSAGVSFSDVCEEVEKCIKEGPVLWVLVALKLKESLGRWVGEEKPLVLIPGVYQEEKHTDGGLLYSPNTKKQWQKRILHGEWLDVSSKESKETKGVPLTVRQDLELVIPHPSHVKTFLGDDDFEIVKQLAERTIDELPGRVVSIPFLSRFYNFKTPHRGQAAASSSGSTGISTEPKPVWVRQLRKDGAGGFEFAGNAFKVIGAATDIDDLKEAIERKAKLTIAAFMIDIYIQQEDGKWKKVEKMGARLQDTDDDNPYGYILP